MITSMSNVKSEHVSPSLQTVTDLGLLKLRLTSLVSVDVVPPSHVFLLQIGYTGREKYAKVRITRHSKVATILLSL